MLFTIRDILAIDPPFLIVFGDGQWRVARRVESHPDGLAFFEPFSPQPKDVPDGVLPGIPWHVGDNLWELDYHTQIMTLDHPHQHGHPGWRLWLHWLSSGTEAAASVPTPAH